MKSKKKIMIVEDENIVAEDLEASLRQLGYEIAAVVSSGESVGEEVRRTSPDLILMDIMLRGELDGIEAITRLKQTADIPVIYLTAHADRATLERAKATEPFGYILKPYEEKELETTIEIALARHQLECLKAKSFEIQRMESIGRLAGGLAHDFNNLLMVIKGYGEYLLEEDGKVSKRSEVQEIIKAADRAIDLTRQLLLFSQRHILQLKTLNLNELIRNITPALRQLSGESFTVKTDLSADQGWVEADPLLMEQIVTNLVLNARDAMPDGGEIKIETSRMSLDEDVLSQLPNLNAKKCIMLKISDTGCGMDEKILPHIFEPFFTTKPGGKGMGLGLSAVYGIVQQLQGTLSVSSRPGEGSSFRIYLPEIEKKDGPKNKTILLAEDETAIRRLLASFLREEGFRVLEAANGVEAIQLFNTRLDAPLDLLLTDMNMPQMGGGPLREWIQKASPETKVILMSGYTDDSIFKQGIRSDEINFLQKPFTNEELLKKIRLVLV